jgi:outer membrane protein assembly factor BamE (lipoprotein component of BamABCDE complex)
MKLVMIGAILCLLVAGCDAINRGNLNKLEVGMSKEQVTTIMGKPYQREVSGEREYWLYETERKNIYRTTPSEYLTPVVFEDGKVAGWGRNYWVEKEKKFDVKIDQTIKQR